MTSQEQQAKYEALVREIAEEMADKIHTSKGGFGFEVIKEYARIAVKHMADEAKKGYIRGAGPMGVKDPLVQKYLHQRGLVPPKTNENE